MQTKQNCAHKTWLINGTDSACQHIQIAVIQTIPVVANAKRVTAMNKYKGGVPEYNHYRFYRNSPQNQKWIPFAEDRPSNKKIAAEIAICIGAAVFIMLISYLV